MNINTQDILNKLLYNNLSQNAEIENNNTVNENLENINSKIFKYNQNNSHILSSDEELKLLLNSLNQAPTKENIELIKILVQNNLPINKDNLDSIIKSTKIFNENSIEKALFLIENKLKPTINIGEQIDNYLSKETLIDKQIDTLFSNINSLGDNNLTKEIFKNSNLESLLNININKLKDFKLELLNHIKTNLSEYKSLERLLNGITNLDKNSTNSNYNKLSNILENILDFNFNEDLSINFEKTNILKNIANTLNENINNQDLLKDNLKNLN
ncbi:hypothetical protein, partial [uncultured Tyzzerella sp.]|uniref:hypothetical protein n=1 Tax=uncultured Tyzzerella sp. TaxID=2321398 RepID=UPI002943EB60